MTSCDTNLDCPQGLDYCHKNDFVSGSVVGPKAGVCAPLECDSNDECPSIGNVCGSGAVSGFCQSGKCTYDSPLFVAGCIPGKYIFTYLLLIVLSRASFFSEDPFSPTLL